MLNFLSMKETTSELMDEDMLGVGGGGDKEKGSNHCW